MALASCLLLPLLLLATGASGIVSSLPSAAVQSLVRKRKSSSGQLPFAAHFFPQQIDHFNFRPDSSRVFYQKYLLNASFWDKGPSHSAPIFVYTGNEGNIEWFAENTGFMLDIAPRFNALLLFIEHRFYGDSMPFGKDSYKSAETLGYLTSTQALADYAVLIRSLKQNLSAEASPVVVYGGSYGGMLAAWFRLKYPHVAIGAVSSSAPILQFDDIVPWSSFYDGVSQDYKDESANCFEVIKESWDQLMTTAAKKGGMLQLTKKFKACKTIQSVYSVRDWLWTAFTYTAMVDYPTPANFLMPLPAYPVKEMCSIIDGFPTGVDKLTKVFSAASLYYNYSGTHSCFDIENDSDPHGLNGWGWQACTEMVMPMTCSNESMFPPSSYSYEASEDQCKAKYGVLPRPHWITTEYGGNRIELVLKRFGSNIIFSNGMRDPWSRGGVLKNISSSIIALVAPLGAHHVDLRFARKDDPNWVKEQREAEIKIIQGWVDQYHRDLKEPSRQ
ncbi:lysosomal Pro-X carboxypeptidase-like [Zingiber officinale]|uniref:lysosomal Pro-X carboxypeptidase-like n=1 Tax=Zingiber officinale TaxID=94328 RepID=UPI001C4D6C9B|nr:lysosomal Pro-X carboxypeptidase-like [Zingiber officinale]